MIKLPSALWSIRLYSNSSIDQIVYNTTSHQKIVIFNQVYAITSSPPETPNEKLFLKRFGDFISDTMNKLRDPPDPTRPQDVW